MDEGRRRERIGLRGDSGSGRLASGLSGTRQGERERNRQRGAGGGMMGAGKGAYGCVLRRRVRVRVRAEDLLSPFVVGA